MDNFRKRQILDSIKGLIWGQCLGDAVGLITEFKFKQDMEFDTTGLPKIQFPYTRKIRDFPKCDWTDDSDHMILVMQSLTANNMKLNLPDFATRLVSWCRKGFPELGDTRGMGLGSTVNMCQINPDFVTRPIEVGHKVWADSGYNIAANGSLMRCSILSTLCSGDIVKDREAIANYSEMLSRVTHADPRCLASCVLYNDLLYRVVHRDRTKSLNLVSTSGLGCPLDLSSVDRFFDIKESSQKARGVPSIWGTSDYRGEFRDYVTTALKSPISDLKLDERGKIGYVLKCLGCALYGLNVINHAESIPTPDGEFVAPSFKKFIYRVVGECGDADTNAAVAGALMGAYLGYDRLPQDWIQATPNHEWLDAQIDAYIGKLFMEIDYEVVVTAQY